MFIVPIFMPTVSHNGNPSTKMIYRAKIHKNNLNQIANVTKRARLPTFVVSIVDNFMLNAAVLNGTQSKWLWQLSRGYFGSWGRAVVASVVVERWLIVEV